MSIISLKHYLNANSDQAPLRQIISLLISRMGSSAAEGDAVECAAFRVDMKQLADGLEPDLPPGSLLIQAETALQALTIHNKRIESLLASQGSEVSHILG